MQQLHPAAQAVKDILDSFFAGANLARCDIEHDRPLATVRFAREELDDGHSSIVLDREVAEAAFANLRSSALTAPDTALVFESEEEQLRIMTLRPTITGWDVLLSFVLVNTCRGRTLLLGGIPMGRMLLEREIAIVVRSGQSAQLSTACAAPAHASADWLKMDR